MKLKKDPLNVIITGVGGQGNVLASQVLGKALIYKGYGVTVGETFGLSQRGGAVMSQIRISVQNELAPLIPMHKADVILSLEPLEALRVLHDYGNPSVVVLTNDRSLKPINVITGQDDYPDFQSLRKTLQGLCKKFYWLKASEIALNLGSAVLTNAVMLGALIAIDMLPLKLNDLAESLGGIFSEEKTEKNLKAFEMGYDLVKKGLA